MNTAARCCLLLLAAAFCLAAAPGRQYEIRMHRPDKAGMKFHVMITAALRSEVSQTVGERSKPPQEQLLGIELHADAEILAVDDKGNDERIAFKVQKCIVSAGEGEHELIPPGKTFIASAGDDGAEFTIDGKKVSDAVAHMLGIAIDLSKWYGLTPDDIYGAPGPEKVGSSWPINQENLAKQAKRRGHEQEGKTEGTLTLDGVTRAGDEPCLRIIARMKTTSGPAPKKKDEGSALHRLGSTFEAEETMLLPVDVASTRTEFSATETSRATYESEQRGRPAKTEETLTRVTNLRATPIGQ